MLDCKKAVVGFVEMEFMLSPLPIGKTERMAPK